MELNLFKKLFRKKEQPTTKADIVNEAASNSSAIYTPLLYAAWFMIGLFVVVFAVLCFDKLANKYEGTVFYISDTLAPEVKDVQFVKRADGSYQAKLYGLINMGTCDIVEMQRPSVNLIPSAIAVSSDVDNLPIIKRLLPEHTNAKDAGLCVGDVIYAINDQLLSHDDWRIAEKYAEDKPNKFSIIRNGEHMDIWCSVDDEGMFGIEYGTSEIILGSIGFADYNKAQDKYHVITIGHNVSGTLKEAVASEVRYILSDEDDALHPVLVSDSILRSEVQDDYGVVFTTSQFLTEFYPSEKHFIGTDEFPIAWDWEIDSDAPATVLIPYIGLYDESGAPIATPVMVDIDAFSGVLVDVDGSRKQSTSAFTVRAYDSTYETTMNIINGEGYKVTNDYSVDASDAFAFLSGMSGCPVIQNNKLVGMVTAVDVNEPTKAYMISAQQLYLNYMDNTSSALF